MRATNMFYGMSKEELEPYKKEYKTIPISSFCKKYKVSNVTCVKLFGNKDTARSRYRKTYEYGSEEKPKKYFIETNIEIDPKKLDLYKSFEDDYYYNYYCLGKQIG